jgi:hypothetical protein
MLLLLRLPLLLLLQLLQFAQGTCLDTPHSPSGGAVEESRLHNVEIGEAAALSSSGYSDFFSTQNSSSSPRPESPAAPTASAADGFAATATAATLAAVAAEPAVVGGTAEQQQQQQVPVKAIRGMLQQHHRRWSVMGTNG